MIALVRIPLIFLYFLAINGFLIVYFIFRPFHRNNVHIGGRLYGTLSYLLGLKVIVRGQENLIDTPCVYIGNHQNSLDLFTICKAVPPGAVTVGKKSLVWIPLFGITYWLAGNILIDRKDVTRAIDTLKLTVKKMQERHLSVLLFPEGTRSYGRGLLPFKMGAFRIAQSSNEPVVMLCASNLHNKVKLNRWNNGTLLVEYSKPEELDDSRSTKQWSQYFHEEMKQKIADLDEEVAQLEKAG